MKNDLVVLRRRKQKIQEKEKENNSKMSAALNQHFFSEMVVDHTWNSGGGRVGAHPPSRPSALLQPPL